MKKVDKEVLKDASLRLMFTMEDSEYGVLLDEFSIIQKQLELMGKVDGIDSVTPMTFPFDVSVTYIREDESETPLKKEDALKNAKNVKDGQIKLPKVVG